MVQKKVILILNESGKANLNLIHFLHSHFEDCLVDAVYLNQPQIKSPKRIGDHFKSMIFNSEGYYNSTNKYKLLFQNSLQSVHFESALNYYDIMIVGNLGYDKLLTTFGSIYESWNSLPILVIPESFSTLIRNIVFVSSSSQSSIVSFKKFCYLFPTLCRESESTLMRIVERKKEKSLSNEKLLFEYLKSKCANLSVHNVHETVHKADKKAMNLSESTLFVTDEAGIDITKWLNSDEANKIGFASFSLSA